jgi:hypothetical protein
MGYMLVIRQTNFNLILFIWKEIVLSTLHRLKSGQFNETATAVDNLNVSNEAIRGRLIKSVIESQLYEQ